MLRFYGDGLEVDVTDILAFAHGYPAVCAGRDPEGWTWLLVQVAGGPDGLSWVCSPVTDRAVEAVRSGQTRPIELCRHNATGWVEVTFFVTHPAVTTRSTCMLCADIELLLARIPEFDQAPPTVAEMAA
ncbi:MAG: hypothetical protein J2P57_13590 [Acidimicrobiaceae bacterium]|nr:hypothetical protein [Acidimicrobiaceae bacterium]